jgi:hypothetical protein
MIEDWSGWSFISKEFSRQTITKEAPTTHNLNKRTKKAFQIQLTKLSMKMDSILISNFPPQLTSCENSKKESEKKVDSTKSQRKLLGKPI